MKKIMMGALFCLASAVVPGHALAAELTDGMTGEEIGQMLEGAGLSHTLMADKNSGTPVAVGKLGQINFVVRALACEGTPVSCAQLLFFANFDLNRPVSEEDYLIVNDFNDSAFDGRAYVVEEGTANGGQIGVDFYIDLTGGVSAEHVTGRLSRWQGVVSSFLEEMRKDRTGS